MTSGQVEQAIAALQRLTPNKTRFAAYRKGEDGKVSFPILSGSPTDKILEKHFLGRTLIGAVSHDETHHTTCVGLDLDGKCSSQNPAVAARAFIDAARAWDVPVLMHTSKSGNGCHIRTLFSEAVPVHLARALYVILVETSGVFKMEAFDKIWPPKLGLGVLALPLQPKFMQAYGGTIGVNPDTFDLYPFEQQAEVILDCPALSKLELAEILFAMGCKTEEHAHCLAGTHQQKRDRQVMDQVDQGLGVMVRHCLAVAHLIENPNVEYRFWFGMMSNFKPFIGGYEVFDEICKLDPSRYNPKKNLRMWNAINGKPRGCQDLDWACPNLGVCGVKSPAGLPMRLKNLDQSS